MQGDRLERWHRSKFDIIITDEAHRSTAATYRAVYDHFNTAQRLGITATAFRQKGSLSDIYDHISFEYNLKQAIKDGYLCRFIAQTIPLKIELGKLSVTGGDFNAEELEEKIEPYLEEIAREVQARAADRKIIVFTPTCEMARKCKEIFAGFGFDTYYAGGDDRSEIAGFERPGKGKILFNSMLCTEGYDHPEIDCVIILRLTQSTGLYCQMAGRGTRLFPYKDNCLLLDFLWNSSNHNLCKPACLVAEDDETEQAMEDILERNTSQPVDLEDAEVEAVSKIRCERERRLADKLNSFKGRDSDKFDPVLESLAVGNGLLANWRAETNWEKQDMSRQQERFLKDSGFDPSGWCKGYANQVITDVSANKAAGLCSPRQMRTLMNNGFPEAAKMTGQEAKVAMNKLTKKWQKAKRWKDYKKDRRER
jgi:superfamily II DNA or RNA helicase